MDTTASSFTARKNAKRAAEKMIAMARRRRSITAFGPAMMGGLRSSGRPFRPLAKSKPKSPRPRLKLTRFRGARQAFNGGFSDAQDASALFT